MAKRRTKQSTPLIVEPHPESYTGFPFITLLKFRESHVLCVVDNATEKHITAYVLDLCGPEEVLEEQVVALADKWFSESSERYPFSIEVSKEGLSEDFSRIYREYDIEHITRVIGPVVKFPMGDNIKVRRRKRKPLPESVLANNKVVNIR